MRKRKNADSKPPPSKCTITCNRDTQTSPDSSHSSQWPWIRRWQTWWWQQRWRSRCWWRRRQWPAAGSCCGTDCSWQRLWGSQNPNPERRRSGWPHWSKSQDWPTAPSKRAEKIRLTLAKLWALWSQRWIWPHLRCEHVPNTVEGSVQGEAPNQVDEEDQVWEGGCEVHHL